jgi:hypothetical protein
MPTRTRSLAPLVRRGLVLAGHADRRVKVRMMCSRPSFPTGRVAAPTAAARAPLAAAARPVAALLLSWLPLPVLPLLMLPLLVLPRAAASPAAAVPGLVLLLARCRPYSPEARPVVHAK